MKLSVPTNWDPQLLKRLRTDHIGEIYGKLARDAIGGGRASFTLPPVSRKAAAAHIRAIHAGGMKFNYLLNATCLGNKEWSRRGQREIQGLLDWLDKAETDSVTVSSPYLLQLIKKRFPRFTVHVSTQVGLSTLREAEYWHDLGADAITLSVHKANRDFPLLASLKKNLSCRIQLIANLFCLKNCPFWIYHGTCNAHSSQTGTPAYRLPIDYCFILCSYMRLKDPVEFIRSEWIRPEDLIHYEKIGVDSIKLVNRTMPTEAIVRAVEAYSCGRYDGNLLDLFSDAGKTLIAKKGGFFRKARHFFHPFSANLFKLSAGMRLLKNPGIHIEQRQLDGFIDHFLNNGGCENRPCAECGHCRETAKKAVRILDRRVYEETLENYEKFLSSLVSGDVFRYVPARSRL